jgi:pesticin/yersiniabactin receptor
VTVTKRPQKTFNTLGEVDIEKAVTLSERGLTLVEQLDRAFGNMNIESRSSSVYSNITMRGQSSVNIYNPSVQVYVDGLPQDQALFASLLPLGLDRVEVLHGPQGTLYGRSAVGDVISQRLPGM